MRALSHGEEEHVLAIEPRRIVNTGDGGGAVTATEREI
jgi:hypothetical protein